MCIVQAGFSSTPLLTIVPGKSPGAPAQLVVNHAGQSPGAQTTSAQAQHSQPAQANNQQQHQQAFANAQQLASPAGGHINLLQQVGVMTTPTIQQFIVPGLVMATDGSGTTTLLQDASANISNIQNIQNIQNIGVQLQVSLRDS